MTRGFFDLGFRSAPPDPFAADVPMAAPEAEQPTVTISPPKQPPPGEDTFEEESFAGRDLAGDVSGSQVTPPPPGATPAPMPPASAPPPTKVHAAPTTQSRSLLGPIVIALVILAIVAGAIYFAWMTMSVDGPHSPAGCEPDCPDPPPTGDDDRTLTSILILLGSLTGFALVLLGLAAGLHFLKKLQNPIYWQVACWYLIAVGILIRPVVTLDADTLGVTLGGSVIAGFVALLVFPVVMRVLNRIKPEPGLIHVALPLALGFFLDVSQFVAFSYVPELDLF